MTYLAFKIPKYRDRTPIAGYNLSKEETAEQVGYPNVQVLTEEESLEAGHYFDGLIFGSVIFEATGTIAVDLKIPNAIIEVTQPNNIVKTSVITKDIPGASALKGTVKEYISMGDDQVTISGVLSSPKGSAQRPHTAIQTLNQWRKQRASLKVQNELLQRLEIYNLVIESIQWLPHQFINTQPFRMVCCSDDPNLYDIFNEVDNA